MCFGVLALSFRINRENPNMNVRAYYLQVIRVEFFAIFLLLVAVAVVVVVDTVSLSPHHCLVQLNGLFFLVVCNANKIQKYSFSCAFCFLFLFFLFCFLVFFILYALVVPVSLFRL